MNTENFEPKWTKNISSGTICSWFYIFFLANVIVMTLIVAMVVYTLVFTKKAVTPSTLFFAFLQLIVAGTNTLFFYLICDRSLKPE
jgi:heme/copper-type cytochrome/quinol oxidase subunit 4